ncbi:glycosyltransferase family 2 protein [Crateriforma conspicua]|uniref:Glycosyltransferase 2-like prokaryotic type domain-containing protein n=1 Tax=Crateriforma conspicua TaxID=2527996 RepID=A0A5C5Y2P5_9PLAN|nr:galactosyltransferase-related protein [Crateriforma conspicua]TWT68525.1 hypothetical protein Pan14r_07710 [Crateriforma conspicua]
MSFSVMTIVRGRRNHLWNQGRSITESHRKPDQWIIVGMNQDVDPPSIPGVEVVIDRVDGDGERLPLAEARNRAADRCSTETMVFLDVDCIASPTLFPTMVDTVQQAGGLWMGDVRYLPKGATTDHWTMNDLMPLSVRHPLQPKLITNRQPSQDYHLFWSLCFGISRYDFETIGGFDTGYEGYGGEDTDFAFTARRAGVPFGFVAAVAYHQHHPVCKPPLNHFSQIVSNAERFRRKWNVWPMESWLDAFAQRDLIRFDPGSDQIDVLRCPSKHEVAAAVIDSPAGF